MNKEISFVGLPDVCSIEQVLQLPSGEYLVISAIKTHYQYEILRVFKGTDLKHLKEISVEDVERYRDGGTTYYKTAEGTIYSPTPFKENEPTT